VAALALAAAGGGAGGADAAVPFVDAAVPHALPAPGAHAARLSAGGAWIVGARTGAATARIAARHGARRVGVGGAYRVPTGQARAFAADLNRRGLLAYSEPDRTLARNSAFEADGPTGWARGNVVPSGLTPPAAPGVIGIIDDLVDTSVPDVAQAKGVKGSVATTPAGPHGTEVASVAAGKQDGQGVIGITPGAPLLSFGLHTDVPCTDVVKGIEAMIDAGAQVLNLSLGTTDDCFLLRLAVADANANDILVVASSGNEFAKNNPVVYPGAYPHVLSVGALGLDLAPTYFSTSNAALDLAEPGESIPVALPLRFDQDGTQDGFTHQDGTSFSAPIASGLASWLMGARPKLAAGQYADLMRDTAKDIGDPGWDPATGFGMVDLAAALQAPTPPVDPLEPNDGITLVNGSLLPKSPYVWKGGAARTLKASVDAVEDPVDVYRIRLGAHRRATVTLTPSKGNADLEVFDQSAKGIQTHPLARSHRTGVEADTVHVTNRRGASRTFYVVIEAPSIKERSFDAQYALRLRRG
jgi:hypothetical protein